MNTNVTKEVIRMPTQEKTTATIDSTSAQSRYFRGRGWQPGKSRGDVSLIFCWYYNTFFMTERYIETGEKRVAMWEEGKPHMFRDTGEVRCVEEIRVVGDGLKLLRNSFACVIIHIPKLQFCQIFLSFSCYAKCVCADIWVCVSTLS